MGLATNKKRAGVPHGKPTRIKTFLRLAFSSYSIYVLSLILCFIIYKTRHYCFYAANIKTFSILPITPPHFSISLTIFSINRADGKDLWATFGEQQSPRTRIPKLTVTISVSLKRHFEMREKFPCKYIDEKETRRLCQNRPLNTVAFQRKPTFPIRIFLPQKPFNPSFFFLSICI